MVPVISWPRMLDVEKHAAAIIVARLIVIRFIGNSPLHQLKFAYDCVGRRPPRNLDIMRRNAPQQAIMDTVKESDFFQVLGSLKSQHPRALNLSSWLEGRTIGTQDCMG